MELWAGQLGPAAGRLVVGAEMDWEASFEASGGLVLGVREAALARMGSLPIYGLGGHPAGLLIRFAADTKPAGIYAHGLKAGLNPERVQ